MTRTDLTHARMRIDTDALAGRRTAEEVQQMLRDVAFVLRMTRVVKEQMRADKPTPRREPSVN